MARHPAFRRRIIPLNFADWRVRLVLPSRHVDLPTAHRRTAQRVRLRHVLRLAPRILYGVVPVHDRRDAPDDVDVGAQNDRGDAGEGVRHRVPSLP